jgi:hypothetical protein
MGSSIVMKVWLQHADFSEDEFQLDRESALQMFRDTDWLSELAAEDELVRNGDDSCPPGLGMVDTDERILHICPSVSGALVHFHDRQKFLGFVSRQKSITLENVRPDRIERFIGAFFDQEWDLIKGSGQ